MARLQLQFLAVVFVLVLFALWANECEGVKYDVNSNGQKVHSSKRLHRSECPSACSHRCSKTTKKACMYFCQYCCKKCLCVPPGTYGNKQVCPCYNNWKTKEGGPKCP